jgi:protein-tyrosine kinase
LPGRFELLGKLGCVAIIRPDLPPPGGAAKAVLALADAVAVHQNRTVVCVDACYSHPELLGLVPPDTPPLQQQLSEGRNDPMSSRLFQQVSGIACTRGGEQDMAALCSPVFSAFCQALRIRYSLVLLMLPPAALFADIGRAAANADGAALIIDSGRTRWETAAECHRRLVDGGITVLGTIMNQRKLYVPSFLYNYI